MTMFFSNICSLYVYGEVQVNIRKAQVPEHGVVWNKK